MPKDLSTLRSHNYQAFVMCIIALNALIALVAIVSNFIIIFTIARTASLRSPSNFLVLSLATTDFITGIIVQPMFYLNRYLEVKDGRHICAIYAFSAVVSWLVASLSFNLLTVITADRFLAIKLQLRYKHIVTKKRVAVAVVLFFLDACIISFMRLTIKSWRVAAAVLIAVLMAIQLRLDIFFIASITRLIRRHSLQIQTHDQSSQPDTFNMMKYKKSVNTMYFVLGAFAVCYLPYLIHLVIFASSDRESVETLYYGMNITTTSLYVNSIVNPVIYFLRNRELRNSAGRIFGCRGPHNNHVCF